VASPSGLIHRLQASLPWRAWQRYTLARGGVLAGGMAYIALFSVFPALAVGFTVFGLIVGDNPKLEAEVVEAVNDALGTVIITPPGGTGGIVTIDQLTASSTLTIAGIVGLVGFLFVGLGWLDAMREGIRAMFGQPIVRGHFVFTKLRDLLVLATIGVLILASAIAGVVVSTATGTVLSWLGLHGSLLGRVLLGGASTLLLLAADVMIFLVIFRLLSGVPVPMNDFWDAALFGGIGFGILKLLGGVLLNGAGNNTFLAAAGVVLGLLVWLNLVSRLTLIAASWGATVAIDRGHLAEYDVGRPMPAITVERIGAGSATSSRPAASAQPAAVGSAVGVPVAAAAFTPVVSPREADRISVLAGAVLGAAGLFALRTAAGGMRSVIDAVRRPDDDED
jgi:membrane protein